MLPLTGVKVKLENAVHETFRVSCREGLSREYTTKTKKGTPVKVVVVDPQAWRTAKRLAGGDCRRLEVLSETEVLVHYNSDWRKKRGCPRIQP